MNRTSIMLALLGLFRFALPSFSAELDKIDRTIAKEPQYSAQPYYALLVVGPEATQRVWLVMDGDVLYVDRNGNGDLTEASERVELDVEATRKINVASGAYKGMNVFNLGEVAGLRLNLKYWVRNLSYVANEEPEIIKAYRLEREKHGWENATLWRITKNGSQAQNPVLLCRRPRDAQISHLAGPLTFTLNRDDRQTLLRGAEPTVFDVKIGTPGLPTRHSRYPIFSPLTTSEVPADLHAVAHFEFPHKLPGQPPIKLQVTLNERCCGDTCLAYMRVPAEAADGMAKVTLSYPAWKEQHVAPATFEVRVAEAMPK